MFSLGMQLDNSYCLRYRGNVCSAWSWIQETSWWISPIPGTRQVKSTVSKTKILPALGCPPVAGGETGKACSSPAACCILWPRGGCRGPGQAEQYCWEVGRLFGRTEGEMSKNFPGKGRADGLPGRGAEGARVASEMWDVKHLVPPQKKKPADFYQQLPSDRREFSAPEARRIVFSREMKNRCCAPSWVYQSLYLRYKMLHLYQYRKGSHHLNKHHENKTKQKNNWDTRGSEFMIHEKSLK